MNFSRYSVVSFTLVLFGAFALAACGPKLVRGESPYVSIRDIDVSGETMVLRLRVQNINDVALETTRVRFTIDLEDEELARYDESSNTSLIANGTETFRLELTASEQGRALLDSLERKEMPNLEYRIDGEIMTVDDGSLNIFGEGRLYPVPGRPGRFR